MPNTLPLSTLCVAIASALLALPAAAQPAGRCRQRVLDRRTRRGATQHAGRPAIGCRHDLQRGSRAREGGAPRRPRSRSQPPRAARRQRADAPRDRAAAQPVEPGQLRPARAELRLRPADAGQAAREVHRPHGARDPDPSDDRRRDGRERESPVDGGGRRAADRRPHRDRRARPHRVRRRAAEPARPPDPRHRAAEPGARHAGRRADVPERRPVVAGRLRRRAERRRQRARPQRLGHADQPERHRLPAREAAAGRRRRQPRAAGDAPGERDGRCRAREVGGGAARWRRRRCSSTTSTPCSARPRWPTTRPSRSRC